jgi:hypothetical protein
MNQRILQAMALLPACLGAFNSTTNTAINMAAHPDVVSQDRSVSILLIFQMTPFRNP